jgi:hypothetical protein
MSGVQPLGSSAKGKDDIEARVEAMNYKDHQIEVSVRAVAVNEKSDEITSINCVPLHILYCVALQACHTRSRGDAMGAGGNGALLQRPSRRAFGRARR